MKTLQVVVPFLQGSIILALTFTAGLASCLSLWAIPIILRPDTTSRSMITQFDETVSRGFAFLQPLSRFMMASLVFLAAATAQLPNPEEASRWKYYLAGSVVLIQAAWYEMVFIFPINDKIKAQGEGLKEVGKEDLPKAEHEKLENLLKRWQALQWGRVIIPLISAVVVLAARF